MSAEPCDDIGRRLKYVQNIMPPDFGNQDERTIILLDKALLYW